MKKQKHQSLTTQYLLVFGILFLVANLVLGAVLMSQASQYTHRLIKKSMLNVSNTAADLLDGDKLGALTANDVGGPEFKDICDDLMAFQNNADIVYIYTVKPAAEGRFVFLVDPDPVDPGKFGEECVVTDALRSAGQGIAAVDDSPSHDRWGTFYRAYSPVIDSKGDIAGIVGVDFNSEWFDRQIRQNTVTTLVVTGLFILISLFVMLFVNNNVRNRFKKLNTELSVLSADVDELTEELMSDSWFEESIRGKLSHVKRDESRTSADEIEDLRGRVRAIHEEMKLYLNFAHDQANTDALTHVGNTKAYSELSKELDARIDSGSADFTLIMFDINDLKKVNDHFGHDRGDQIIIGAAAAIARVFGTDRTFRIGGDEFIAVAENAAEQDINGKLAELEGCIREFNKKFAEPGSELSVSYGSASYVPGRDADFRSVFVRADSQMYSKKDRFHEERGERE